MAIFSWVLLSVIPAVGLLILWLVLYRWGRKHDAMKRTHFDYYTPGYGARNRDPDGD